VLRVKSGFDFIHFWEVYFNRYEQCAITGSVEALGLSAQCPGRSVAAAMAQCPTFVHRNGGAAAVAVAILDVRPALADSVETQPFEQPADLGGFEDGH
jgi:hypothetical protein